jgi:SAM-dependent methyltransferase
VKAPRRCSRASTAEAGRTFPPLTGLTCRLSMMARVRTQTAVNTARPSNPYLRDRSGPSAQVARQERVWSRRADEWSHDRIPGLAAVADAVIDRAEPLDNRVVVDLGCGSGQLTLPIARRARRVIAVDLSAAMLDRLGSAAAAEGLANIDLVRCPLEGLDLARASVDLVVSNYALHHLDDADKTVLARRAVRWLRPGGGLVIGDMMFGRGADAGDRRIIASKFWALARRGPGGWWRIIRNVGRFVFRVHEKPLPMSTWQRVLSEAGFTNVEGARVVAEAAVVGGTAPHQRSR